MNIVGEIKFFLGDGDHAQLKFSETKTSFSIDIVTVPVKHRNQGIGKTLIKHILLLADSMGKEVYVAARPIGAFSEEKLQQLVKYYQKFGFEVSDKGLTVIYMCKKHKNKGDEMSQ